MNKNLLALLALTSIGPCFADAVGPAPNGLILPADYRDWRVIAVSQRTETSTLRVILGNDIAIQAARAGKTQPWPEGSMLAKIAWQQTNHPKFATAVVPGEFVHTDLMVKDSGKFANTGGWGFARWKGASLAPYGQDANAAQECFGCHSAAKDSDWVFTAPAKLP